MATSCFFCSAKHGLSEREYDIPLCGACHKMERFQILLLQQLCFIQTSLYEIKEALDPDNDTYMLGPKEMEG